MFKIFKMNFNKVNFVFIKSFNYFFVKLFKCNYNNQRHIYIMGTKFLSCHVVASSSGTPSTKCGVHPLDPSFKGNQGSKMPRSGIE